MTSPLDDPQVHEYLTSMENCLAQFHAEQSEEVLTGIAEHITDAQTQSGRPVREILASLGTPEQVVASMAVPGPISFSQGPPPQTTPQPRQSGTLWAAITCILLPFGGFLAGVGWLFGVVGLWMGTRWKTWEKIMGTVILPGGLLGSMYLLVIPAWSNASSQTISYGTVGAEAIESGSNPLIPTILPGIAAVVVVLLPLAVAAYLLITAVRRNPGRPSSNTASMRHN